MTVGREDTEWPGWLWCTTMAGASGWAPVPYLRNTAAGFVAVCDYDATELVAEAGECLTVEQEVNGWVWCSASAARAGWVPVRNVEPINEAADERA